MYITADFDGSHASAERITAYCDAVANNEPMRPLEPAKQISVVIICRRGAEKPSRYEQELKRGAGRLAL